MNTKRRRIFLAVNLPNQVKRQLIKFQEQWSHLPVRWTREQNLHITLVFVGYVDDDEMLEVCRLTKEAIEQEKPFEIELNQICYGPLNKQERMIWVMGKKNEALGQLREKLSGLIENNSHGNWPFRSHITLARIKQDQWRQLPEKPIIDQEISLVFSVDSIEVMQSHLSRQGPDYAVLESVELGS